MRALLLALLLCGCHSIIKDGERNRTYCVAIIGCNQQLTCARTPEEERTHAAECEHKSKTKKNPDTE